ncbi:MAG: hypothetical protein J6M91_05715 [Methanobrevibacter sp.]|nr:hypothetical protein [Methanobrevibacter sp.]
MEKAAEEIIEKLEQAVSGMNMSETVSYLSRYLTDNIHLEYRSEIIETCRRILEEKNVQISKQVMIELAEKDITDYDEVMKVALDYGLSKEQAEALAETVRRYEEEHVFNARELSKVDFRKYCNNLLIVSGIDNVTKALIVKAGFKLKPNDNSMIVMCYIDHVYGARFYLIAPASRNEIGEIEIGERNNELSLELCLDSFDGKVEEYPGGAKVSKDMIEKIQKIANDKKVSDGVEESRNIIGLDYLRVPGYPDDVVVYFSKSDTEYENVVCRIEDYDKNLRKFKVKILKEPVGTYGKHMGDIIEARLIITQNGQHRIYSYFNQDSSNQENVKVLKPTDFLVRTSDYQCTFKNHELVQVTVVVNVLNPNEIIEAEFPAYYL